MAFIMLDEDTMINSDCIESVSRKGKLSVQIIMESGEKHLASLPFENIKAILKDKGGSLEEIIKNIDNRLTTHRG